jgi:hypothetical protein
MGKKTNPEVSKHVNYVIRRARTLNRPRVIGQDRFGNAVSEKGDHSLYWIPVQYWSAIVLVIGTILVFKK